MGDGTTLNGSAVEKVAGLARDAQEVQQIELEDGRILADKDLTTIYDPDDSRWPGVLQVASLTGLVDYLDHNPDELDLDKVMVFISGPENVGVVGAVEGPARQRVRHDYLVAMPETPRIHLDHYLPLEDFLIQLRTRFQPTDALDELVALLGNVTASAVETATDDGFSQKVSTRAGVALENEDLERIPNPVELRPIRTFPEIEDQPASPFTVRLKIVPGGVEAALFEADGGAWKQRARLDIYIWLEEQLDHRVGDVKLLA